MGRSVKGGVYGFLRGKVGSVSYSIMKAKQSSSGKKEQIVRILPDSVDNPNTIGQVMQRMKVAPAQKFYAALSTILSNSWQGVTYGEKSRQYFLAQAMKMQGGPYVPKGTDRFIPGEYPISEGELNSVPLLRFQGNEAAYFHIGVEIGELGVTPEKFAAALGVSVDTQITFIVINNDNGVFVPHFAGWSERITIADLPAGVFVQDPYGLGGNIAINPGSIAGIGILTNVVAVGIILSRQDASGNWLRSSQSLVLSNQMYSDLYSENALNAAIASYRDTTNQNSVGSEWYLNLGLNQAFNGRVYAEQPIVPEESDWIYKIIMGETIEDDPQFPGAFLVRQMPFATSLAADGLVMILSNGVATTDSTLTVEKYMTDFRITGNIADNFRLWNPAYATQAGF